MTEHKLLIVEKGLLERIDSLRGQETRQAFLERRISMLESAGLEASPAQDVSKSAAGQAEASGVAEHEHSEENRSGDTEPGPACPLEPARGINRRVVRRETAPERPLGPTVRDRWTPARRRVLLTSLSRSPSISTPPPHDGAKSRAETRRLKRASVRLDNPKPGPDVALAASSGGSAAATPVGEPLPAYVNPLWVAAVLLFGLGDTLTSILVFANGGYEANPFLTMMVGLLGGSVLAFVLVKTAALFGLMFVSYRSDNASSWMIPLLVSLAGAYLTIHNLSSLIG